MILPWNYKDDIAILSGQKKYTPISFKPPLLDRNHKPQRQNEGLNT